MATTRNSLVVLVLSLTQPLQTLAFSITQITPANVNNTSSMDQVLPSLSVTGYVASSLSISVFLMVYSALITSLRLRSILNTRTEPLRAEPRRFCFFSVCQRSGIPLLLSTARS